MYICIYIYIYYFLLSLHIYYYSHCHPKKNPKFSQGLQWHLSPAGDAPSTGAETTGKTAPFLSRGSRAGMGWDGRAIFLGF